MLQVQLLSLANIIPRLNETVRAAALDATVELAVSVLRCELGVRIEDFVVTLLLPIFFVYTGLKMNITLLDRPALWLITIGLIVIAIKCPRERFRGRRLRCGSRSARLRLR